mgnify:CR=1 FL=1
MERELQRGQRGIAVLEAPRTEMDRLTDGAVHQGLALQVPPYSYKHPDDLMDVELPGGRTEPSHDFFARARSRLTLAGTRSGA